MLRHRVAHRREVHHRGDAGEVLHQHARGRERDLDGGLSGGVQPASASMSAARDRCPEPSVRSRFSSSTFSENGSRATSKRVSERAEAEDLVLALRPPRACPGRRSCCRAMPPVNQKSADTLLDRGSGCDRSAQTAPARRGPCLRACCAAAPRRRPPAAARRSSGPRHWATPIEARTPASSSKEGTSARRCSARSAASAALSRSASGRITDELVAPVAGDAVEGAELALQRARDPAQHAHPPRGARGGR